LHEIRDDQRHRQANIWRFAAACNTVEDAQTTNGERELLLLKEIPPRQELAPEVRVGEPDLCKGFDEGSRPTDRTLVKQVFDGRAVSLDATELKHAVIRAVGGANAAAPGHTRKRVLMIVSDAATGAPKPHTEVESAFTLVPGPLKGAAPALWPGRRGA
jgi:hypothetical protein